MQLVAARPRDAAAHFSYERWFQQVSSLAYAEGLHTLTEFFTFNWYGQWDYGSTPLQAYERFIARCL